jgi:hypothetical protein
MNETSFRLSFREKFSILKSAVEQKYFNLDEIPEGTPEEFEAMREEGRKSLPPEPLSEQYQPSDDIDEKIAVIRQKYPWITTLSTAKEVELLENIKKEGISLDKVGSSEFFQIVDDTTKEKYVAEMYEDVVIGVWTEQDGMKFLNEVRAIK